MSLKTLITTNYSISIYKQTTKLQDYLCKYARAKNQTIFLTRCLHHEIIPKFLNVHSPIKSTYATKITKTYQQKLLRTAIKDAKSRLHKYNTEVNRLKTELRNKVSSEHYGIISDISESCREKKFVETRTKLKKKFELLKSNQMERISEKSNGICTKHVKDCVLNLVNDEIPDDVKTVLNLGPKFAVTPTKIPYMEIATITEETALKLEYARKPMEADLLRLHTKEILKHAKAPKSNLDRNTWNTIKRMREDESIDYYPFDKGSGFVRISRDDAVNKVENEIGNTIILDKDPTKTLTTKFQKLLLSIKKEINMSNDLYFKLYPSDGTPPRLYGQIKAHKPTKNYPMRNIVSTVGSPAYQVSSYLTKIIQPTLNKNVSKITNSSSFVSTAKNWIISPTEIQVSYDVIALYPSIPIKKATTVILEIIRNDFDDFKTRTPLGLIHIGKLINLCMENSYFLWNGRIHKLVDSGPIGLSLMVILAEGFLQVLEHNAIQVALSKPIPIAPITHHRYVDDSHDRFNVREEGEEFLKILNTQEPRIQYTAEYEDQQKCLNFLDCSLTNNGKGKYETKVHRKSAITNVQIKPTSNHDDNIKYGVFKGFLHRAKQICSDAYLEEEIKFLVDVFTENGYERKTLERIVTLNRQPRNTTPDNRKIVSLPYIPSIGNKLKQVYAKAGLKVVYKSGRNLQSILSNRNKPKLPANSYPGCYRVPCKCSGNYIGETKKRTCSRFEEHQKAIFTGKTADSALSEHAIDNCNMDIDWDNAKSIATEPQYFKRCVRESLEIQRERVGPRKDTIINRESGKYVTTQIWLDLFEHINTEGDS